MTIEHCILLRRLPGVRGSRFGLLGANLVHTASTTVRHASNGLRSSTRETSTYADQGER